MPASRTPDQRAPSGGLLRLLTKPVRVVTRRLRTQGLRPTLIWLYARGVAKLTGYVPLRYSRITPQLYVGPQHGRLSLRPFARAGITANVNLRVEYDDAAHGLGLVDYCHLPTVDETAPTLEHLAQGVQFIRRAIEAGGSVYIHCAGGVGRAPTQAAAYLVATGMALDDAVALITRGRPFIDILPPQMARLREYEALVRADAISPPEMD